MSLWQATIGSDGHVRVSHHQMLARSKRLRISVEPFSRSLAIEVPDYLEDLVHVACAVHAVDRLVPRRHSSQERDQHRWNRQIRVQLSVRCPDLWMRPAILEALLDTLGYLTEDDWEFDFLPREHSYRRRPIQSVLFSRREPTRIGLFSGGLDSLVGLAAHAQHNEGTFVPLAVGLSSRLLGRQKELLVKASNDGAGHLKPIVFPFRFSNPSPARMSEERSQRTRGFLFGSLAAVAAQLTGSREILLFENGIGAINLPLTESQLGAQSTRSTHPIALKKLRHFLAGYLDRDISLDLPYLRFTKGEACRSLKRSSLQRLVGKTISCDSFPLRMPHAEQCGTCTSCLLRRQALFSAGIEDSTPYQHDLLGPQPKIPARHLLPLKDMLWQVHRLDQALGRSDSWSGLALEFPALMDVAQTIAAKEQLVNLYRRYVDEWSCFPVTGRELAFAA
jgi:hypothetical protein